MTVSEEMLLAYIDGELSADDIRIVEAALKAQPELQAFVQRHRQLRRTLESSFAAVLDEEVPQRFMETLEGAPVSRRWRATRRLNRLTRGLTSRSFLMRSGIPSAAALACGLLLGLVFTPQGAFQVDRATGEMTARGALAVALNTGLASQPVAPHAVHIGLTFRSKDGRYCRTFESAGRASSLAGVACRAADEWAIAALRAGPARHSAYHMAAGMPDAIRAAVTGMIAGAPLDALAERRARDANWR